MSGSNDNLKDMFTEAFAVEQIPVDMGAWNQMEGLLNKRKPFGFAYWALLPFLLLLSGIMSWYGFTNINEAMHSPRAEHADLAAMSIIGNCDNGSGIHTIMPVNAANTALTADFAPNNLVEKSEKAQVSRIKNFNYRNQVRD